MADLRVRLTRLVRRGRGPALPIADARRFAGGARRTRLIGLVLAASLLAAAVLAVFASPSQAGRKFLPAGTTGIVVLDVSSSVQPSTYYRIEHTLASIAATQCRLGLVLFSDVAYEALPPGTPAAELKPMLRFFAPQVGTDIARASANNHELPRTPWDQWFSAGHASRPGCSSRRTCSRSSRSSTAP